MTPTKLVPVQCEECGTTFSRYPSQLIGKARLFCSRACLGRSKQRGRTHHCALCDTPFYRRPAEADAGALFCSRACYMESRAASRSDGTYPKVGSRHVHRIVAEAVLGRSLAPGEVVHHVDEDKRNNHPSNLAVFPDQATHVRCHFGEMSPEELDGYRLKP